MDLPAARQTADTVGRHVLAGVYGDHPRRLPRRRGVDLPDVRMSMRAAEDERVKLARPVDVVGVGAPSGQKPVILTPSDRGSDGGHGATPRPLHGHWAAPRR